LLEQALRHWGASALSTPVISKRKIATITILLTSQPLHIFPGPFHFLLGGAVPVMFMMSSHIRVTPALTKRSFFIASYHYWTF